MKQEINRFTAYTNCPPGEYDAILNKSEMNVSYSLWPENYPPSHKSGLPW